MFKKFDVIIGDEKVERVIINTDHIVEISLNKDGTAFMTLISAPEDEFSYRIYEDDALKLLD